MTTRTLLLALGGLVACDKDPAAEPDPCRSFDDAPAGTLCTVVGVLGVAMLSEDGLPPTESPLYLPVDFSVGPDGRWYVIDWNNHRLRRVTDDGVMETFAGAGTLGDGPEGDARAAAFNHPTNLAFHPADDQQLWVAAWHNSRIERIDLATNELDFVCGTGDRAFSGNGGPCALAALDLPSSIAFDDDGTLYVADTANQIVRKVDLDGVITTVAGTEPPGLLENGQTDRRYGWEGDGGPADHARFNFGWGQRGYPGGRILRDGRRLYIADTYNFVVRVLDLDSLVVDHFAGRGLLSGYAGDGGPAAEAQLGFPTDIAIDGAGNVFIADTFNHCVRQVDASGVITTVVGVCTEPGTDGDGGPATEAHLLNPFGVEYADGVLFVSDTENQAVRAVRL